MHPISGPPSRIEGAQDFELLACCGEESTRWMGRGYRISDLNWDAKHGSRHDTARVKNLKRTKGIFRSSCGRPGQTR